MKKSSGELIREAIEHERTALAADERKRIVRLLEALKRGYYLTGDVKAYQTVNETIATIERNS